MKRLFKLFLCVILIFSLSISCYAYNDMQSVANGAYLQVLGVLKGTEKGLELNKSLTRTEAIVLVIRLTGNEEIIESYNGSIPFSDVPQWATNYVAYAYDTGITNGITKDTFGSNRNVTLNQFTAFLLRVLGYKDGIDFEYSKAYQFANNLGAMKYLSYKGDFKRADAADVCAGFMESKMKDSDITLYAKLYGAGLFSQADIQIADYTRESTLLAGSVTEEDIDSDTLEMLMAEEEARVQEEAERAEELRDLQEEEKVDVPIEEEPTEEPAEVPDEGV